MLTAAKLLLAKNRKSNGLCPPKKECLVEGRQKLKAIKRLMVGKLDAAVEYIRIICENV